MANDDQIDISAFMDDVEKDKDPNAGKVVQPSDTNDPEGAEKQVRDSQAGSDEYQAGNPTSADTILTQEPDQLPVSDFEEPEEDAPVESKNSDGAPSLGDNIQGYRNLSQDEISWMNTVKSAERELSAVAVNIKELAPNVDPRLWDLARTHFETGFMYLTRSIAKPEDLFDTRA